MDINNNLQLNVIVPIILILFLSVLCVHGFIDNLWKIRNCYKSFILWLITEIIYIGLFAACYYTKYVYGITVLYKIFYAAFMLVGSFIYAFIFLWIAGMIKEKHKVKMWLIVLFLLYCFIVCVLPFHYIIYNYFPENIKFDNPNNYLPLTIYNFGMLGMFVFITIFIISSCKYVGKFDFVLFLCVGSLPHFVQFIKIWTIVPYLIVNSILLLIIYLRQWQERKKEMVTEKLQIAEKNQEIAEKEQLLSETRMDLMLSQIQPHFLYNSLNSIASLCGTDPQRAQEITISFADYLRMQLDSMKENTPVPFRVELEHTQVYVNIEKVRFGKRLVVEYDIRNEDFNIPPLTIQPIVENAIKHGVMQRRMGGKVIVRSLIKEDGYYIYVIDDGVGFDVNAEPKKDGKSHIGFNAVKQRLAVKCKGTIDIESTIGEGTTVTIFIPMENKIC